MCYITEDGNACTEDGNACIQDGNASTSWKYVRGPRVHWSSAGGSARGLRRDNNSANAPFLVTCATTRCRA